MAFAKIKSTLNSNFIKVELGIYDINMTTDYLYIRKSHLATCGLGINSGFVELIFNSGNKYQLTGSISQASQFMYIDEVFGVAVTDNEDLLNKIFAIL